MSSGVKESIIVAIQTEKRLMVDGNGTMVKVIERQEIEVTKNTVVSVLLKIRKLIIKVLENPFSFL